uniref:J domain-containing protein n=1 Tax=Peronospora matthiolae TaxID=2874970 RepID=A0AAV1TI64_9STRA
MLSGKLFRRSLQRSLRAPQPPRRYAVTRNESESVAQSLQQDDGSSCWKCDHVSSSCSFFCRKCDAIQPLSKRCNYFEMFNIPKNFKLEPRSIEKTYWNLLKRLHPDLYGSKSEFEQELSAANAAVVNDAYKILKTANTRVKYLLSLDGIDALGETASTAVNPELLMEMMGIRERIATAANVDVLHDIREELLNRIDDVIKKLDEVYDKDQDLEAAKGYAVELQYTVKCVEEIDLREEKLDG